jgi:hypothetical protein
LSVKTSFQCTSVNHEYAGCAVGRFIPRPTKSMNAVCCHILHSVLLSAHSSPLYERARSFRPHGKHEQQRDGLFYRLGTYYFTIAPNSAPHYSTSCPKPCREFSLIISSLQSQKTLKSLGRDGTFIAPELLRVSISVHATNSNKPVLYLASIRTGPGIIQHFSATSNPSPSHP